MSRTITSTVEDFEYDEIELYARAKGFGGRRPASTFVHYSAFQQMKKYPLSEAERAKYASNSGKRPAGRKAVQPGANAGKESGEQRP
jgi:cold shock CspA family protein